MKVEVVHVDVEVEVVLCLFLPPATNLPAAPPRPDVANPDFAIDPQLPS